MPHALRQINESRPHPLRLLFDSAELGTDHPKPFGAGVAEGRDPVLWFTLVEELGYPPTTYGRVKAWIRDHGNARGCPAIDADDVVLINSAALDPNPPRLDWAPTPSPVGSYRPSEADERWWVAQTLGYAC